MAAARDGTLIIRADAGPRIGLGHQMRCLALAEAWKEKGGPAVLVTKDANEAVLRRAEREGFGLIDVPHGVSAMEDAHFVSDVLAKYPRSWAVLDGYAFDASYHRALRASGHPLLVVDDMAHLPSYDVDALLNQNAHATLLEYRTPPDTKRLFGLPYVLLRREFRARRRGPRVVAEVARKVLVTLGGADPTNATRAVAEVLLDMPRAEIEATVALGPENAHRAAIENLVRSRGTDMEILSAVEDMAALMDTAELAIVSGGSTVWELAYLGIPALVLPVGPQEELLARGLAHVGLSRVLDPAVAASKVRLKDEVYRALHDVAWREAQSRKGPQLVDGVGADRVVNALAGLGGAPNV